MSLIYLDCETTGLGLHHDIWEIAWAVDDGPIMSAVVPHSLRNADPKALELNGYWTRGFAATPVESADVTLREVLEGNTIVAANPTFDATRLELRWGCAPWHYRLIDISSMAYGLGFVREDGRPMGLFDVAKKIGEYHDVLGMPADHPARVPMPDHTAAADVATLRACFYALQGRKDWEL